MPRDFHIHACISTSVFVGALMAHILAPLTKRFLRGLLSRMGSLMLKAPESATVEVLSLVQKRNGGGLFHSFSGSTGDYLPLRNADAVLQRIRTTGKKTIHLILHVKDSEIPFLSEIIQALVAYKASGNAVHIYVPYLAHGHATLLALAGNLIITTGQGEFTSFDPQVKVPCFPSFGTSVFTSGGGSNGFLETLDKLAKGSIDPVARIVDLIVADDKVREEVKKRLLYHQQWDGVKLSGEELRGLGLPVQVVSMEEFPLAYRQLAQ